MAYGERALALVKEVNQGLEAIAPYNEQLVKDISIEILHLIDENKNLARQYEETTSNRLFFGSVRVQHSALQRNLRCLLAYHYNRLRKVRDIRWDFGSILPNDIRSNMSADELDWFKNYNKMLTKFMKNLGEGEGLNLCVDTSPPKTLYIEVQCTADVGEYELMDGTVIFLKKGQRYFLTRRDCEEFVRRGIFLHVSGLG